MTKRKKGKAPSAPTFDEIYAAWKNEIDNHLHGPLEVRQSTDGSFILTSYHSSVVIGGINDVAFYLGGTLHRENGPARIFKIDSEEDEHWYWHGQRHREDGPCTTIRYKSGSVTYEWRRFGQLHREGGPAHDSADSQEWWLNGQMHRTDGPAVIRKGKEEWWINGEEVDPLVVFTMGHKV